MIGELIDNTYARMCIRAAPLQAYWRRRPTPRADMNPPDFIYRHPTVNLGQLFLRGWPEVDTVPRMAMVTDIRQPDDPLAGKMFYVVPERILGLWRKPTAAAVLNYIAQAETDPAAQAALVIADDEPYVRISREEIVSGPYSAWRPPTFEYRLLEEAGYTAGRDWRAQHYVSHEELTRRGDETDPFVLHWLPRQGELEHYIFTRTAPSVQLWEAVEQAQSLAADFMEFCSRELRAGHVLPVHPHDRTGTQTDPPLLTPASVWLCYVMWKCHAQVWRDKEGRWVEQCDAPVIA